MLCLKLFWVRNFLPSWIINLKQFRNIELVALQPRGDSFENRNYFEIFIKLYLGGKVSYEV